MEAKLYVSSGSPGLGGRSEITARLRHVDAPFRFLDSENCSPQENQQNSQQDGSQVDQ
jgi:hypothetical protein